MSPLHRGALVASAAAALCLAAAAPPPAAAPAPPAPSAAETAGHPSEVSLPDTRRIAFVSKVNGHGYSIDVSLPPVPPPPNGYPVIYVLDGDGYFASMAEAVRLNGNAPQAVVVGIGYPHDPAWPQSVLSKHQPLPPPFAAAPPFDAAFTLSRTYDLTLPADAEVLKANGGGGVFGPQDVGGVDDFLKTIETEVKPRVYALAPVNKDDQTLFGHSLGGLAVVDALFTEPAAFRTFVAASPSIWWSNEAVLKKEAAFDAMITSGKAEPRVLITVAPRKKPYPTCLPRWRRRRPPWKRR
ncbi:MAG TPA: alpha/beta hydrolase-fold protein [Caulobacteraceae bacterium]|jgi:hypothetical protein|nr:alpha/beta hydrolase-fold protein [Caulobacteraceae bacterium]